MKKNKQFLYDYLNAYAPVAQETEGQKIWTDYITPFSDFMYTDAYGTSYGVLKRKLKKYDTLDVNTHKVVIEAHCDEIAWIITNIEADGMIRVKRHGGSDNMIAPSKTVMIHAISSQCASITTLCVFTSRVSYFLNLRLRKPYEVPYASVYMKSENGVM